MKGNAAGQKGRHANLPVDISASPTPPHCFPLSDRLPSIVISAQHSRLCILQLPLAKTRAFCILQLLIVCTLGKAPDPPLNTSACRAVYFLLLFFPSLPYPHLPLLFTHFILKMVTEQSDFGCCQVDKMFKNKKREERLVLKGGESQFSLRREGCKQETYPFALATGIQVHTCKLPHPHLSPRRPRLFVCCQGMSYQHTLVLGLFFFSFPLLKLKK